ncbi:MAG: hypothetical protein ABI988_13060 [Nitrospirota bacterium]
MISIPKVVGVMSCGVLLCLGLSGNTALATDEMQPGQSADRIGGQAGLKGEEEKLEGVVDDPSAMRKGRTGGQAGLKDDEEKLKRSPVKK